MASGIFFRDFFDRISRKRFLIKSKKIAQRRTVKILSHKITINLDSSDGHEVARRSYLKLVKQFNFSLQLF